MRRLFLILGLLVPLALTTAPPALADAADDLRRGVQAYAAEDFAEAVEWFRKAAAQGHAGAQFNLGSMYRRGEGVAQDDKATVEWYRKAAEQGDDKAQFTLGYMYANGEDVAQDFAEAVKWYRKAAEQGHTDAQYSLGVMYTNGKDVAQNLQEAYKWSLLAAAQGDATSKVNAGRIEEHLTAADKQAAQDEAAALQAEIEARQ